MRPAVSVVLPFRNAEATLREALASVLDERGSDFELIAVDDGSDDGSAAVAAACDDPRLRRIANPGPRGVAGAANAGIRAARGDWIARMDADDRALPGRLAVQLAFAAARPGLGVVSGGVRALDSRGRGMERYIDWVNGLRGPGAIAAARFVESPVVNPASMVRRDWLEWAGGYREVPWAEDHDLWLRLLEAGCRIDRAPETVLEWRDSAARLTRSDPRYGGAARMAMRAHFLARLPAVAARGAVVAGAGPTGKSLVRGLLAEGVTVHGFFEVDPRKIGQRIHGVAVRDGESLSRAADRPVLLGAVGVPGGRRRVGEWAARRGYREGVDFWPLC